MTRTLLALILLGGAVAVLGPGCDLTGVAEVPDSGKGQGGSDAARADAGLGPADAAGRDAGSSPSDAGPSDAGPSDAGPSDAGPSIADGGSGDAGGGPCQDSCPAPHGLTWDCKKRFALGTNWAWHEFGADFGGIAAWNKQGVSQNPDAFRSDLAAMTSKKVNVIRWWMFPRLDSSGIVFGADDVPTGIGGTLLADLEKGLELAEQSDVYLMLTLFSFDNFRPTQDESGVHHVGLQPIVIDAGKRKRLVQNLVAPVAAAVEASRFKKRALAWDVINEPEWAMTGPNSYGGQPFEPQSGFQAVTHSEMEAFVSEVIAALHAHSSAPVSVGSAAIKWGNAWKHVNLDFYQLHYYDWVYEWFPYTTHTLESENLTDKPVVLGEFPNAGLSAIPSKNLPARSASQFAADLWDRGYAGALSWAYSDTAFPWSSLDLATFQESHNCETKF
jgi:hypothetical protein